YAEAAAEERQWNAQLDPIAFARCLPRAFDSRFVEGFLAPVLARFDAPCVDIAGARRRQKHLPLDSAGVLEADPDTIAERGRVEEARVGGVEDELVVTHVQQCVEHAIADAGEDAESIVTVAEVLPGARRVGPLIDVAIDERLAGKGNGNEIVPFRLRQVLAS